MSDPAKISADGTSSLSRSVNLLILLPRELQTRISRDAAAIHLLTEPALPIVINRVECLSHAEATGTRTARFVRTQRIWTRRDERRVNLRLGMAVGCWPACRVARYLSRIRPLCASTFRDAVAEARRDREFEVIGPKLEAARGALQKLLNAASAISQDDGRESDFQLARTGLAEATDELIQWVRPSNSRTANEPQPTYQEPGELKQTESDDRKRDALTRIPSDQAIACYRVQIVTGMTQQTLASHMTKALKRSISQGQVSRWLKQVKEWLRAGNVLPDLPEPARRQPVAVDPAVIDMGARVDGHTQRQRHRRSEDSDD